MVKIYDKKIWKERCEEGEDGRINEENDWIKYVEE